MFATGYRCLACSREQPWSFNGLLCPDCGGNLDIRYDYSAAAFEFTEQLGGRHEGVFRYNSLLPVERPQNPFPLLVGATPMVRADRLAEAAGLERLYLKDEGRNPSASLKDRASAVVVRRAIDIDAPLISAASTGNAGSSLACMGAAQGLDTVIFVPETAPTAKLVQAMCFGARLLAVHGSYDDAFELCQQASEAFGWYNRSTGLNPFTREGKKTCAYEIWEDLGRRVPDRVVIATGDGNIMSGIWKGWLDLKAMGLIERLPKLDCAQSSASAAIGDTISQLRSGVSDPIDWSTVNVAPVNATTLADSISVDLPRDGLAAVRAVLASGGEAIQVSDESILEAVAEMSRLSGIFPEPAAAAPWAALRQMSERGIVDSGELIVCIVTGNGLKDVPGAQKAAGKPIIIEPHLDAVLSALNL